MCVCRYIYFKSKTICISNSFLDPALSSLGALMLTAWMLTGSVGTFIANFYKPEWPEKTLLGQKIWFQVDIAHATISNSNNTLGL